MFKDKDFCFTQYSVFQEPKIVFATKPRRGWTGVTCCVVAVATTPKKSHSRRDVTASSTGVATWSARPVSVWWTFTPVNKDCNQCYSE